MRLRKPQLPATKRREIRVSSEAAIKTGFLTEGASLPIEIQPAVDGFDLIAWCRHHKQLLEEMLIRHKAILFRGCGIDTIDTFSRFVTALYRAGLMEYKDRSTPRQELAEMVYTSTVYPAEWRIALHNEGTYWIKWPLKLVFCCLVEPMQGGETPIADSSRIYQRIPEPIRRKFTEKHILYVRNYNDGFGITWQDTFQTHDRVAVEEYCLRNDIEYSWKPGNRLRTRQIRRATAKHPKTGEMLWFNHAAFFHISSLDPVIRDTLVSEFCEEDLPYNTYYGDGSPIENDVAEVIRAAYRVELVQFPWKKGDVMVLDNMSVCHGRASFSGPRNIVVAMAEPFSESLTQIKQDSPL